MIFNTENASILSVFLTKQGIYDTITAERRYVMNNFGDFKVKSNQNYVYHSYRKYHPVLCIYDAAISYPDKNYKHTRDTRFAAHLFEYIVSGKGYIDYGGKRYAVTAGDCVYISKKCEISYFSDKDDPYTKLWFSADGVLPEKLCEALGFDGDLYICKKNLYSKFQRLLHILENDGFELERISKHLFGIMLTMFTDSEEAKDETDTAAALSDAVRIKTYIDEIIHSAPTVGDIAKHFDICEATVIRHFKKEFGITPNDYIKKQRLNVAEGLLRNSSYSVTNIAKLLNYCSQSYFSGEFKKQFGVYPTEYRKQLTQTACLREQV